MVNRNDFFRIVSAILCGFLACPVHGSTEPMTNAQLTKLVTDHFGSKVRHEASSGGVAGMPRYMRVSLTGKRLPVLVVPIHIDDAQGTLNARPIKVVTRDQGNILPDEAVGGKCLALAFFHGLHATKGEAAKPSEVYMLYDCFSGYTRGAKGARLLRDARVHAEGEAVLLDLETGGQLLVYWSGDRYRTKLVRMGC